MVNSRIDSTVGRRPLLLSGLLLMLVVVRGDARLKAEGPAGAKAPLVIRSRVKLNLAGSEMIIACSKAKAAEMKLSLNIAVVDDGGHLLAFGRMDGARPASATTAMTKAVTAAMMRQPTGPIRRGEAEPDVLLNLSLQNAAAAGGRKITTLDGGVPVVMDGQVIGAVGVGGGTGEQDAEVASAGIDALLQAAQAEEYGSVSPPPDSLSAAGWCARTRRPIANTTRKGAVS